MGIPRTNRQRQSGGARRQDEAGQARLCNIWARQGIAAVQTGQQSTGSWRAAGAPAPACAARVPVDAMGSFRNP